jgi:hypothetical protein
MPQAGQHGSSGVGDASGSDAAEFFGELLLELEAHVGRAAEGVRQLVQHGSGELRQGLELSALASRGYDLVCGLRPDPGYQLEPGYPDGGGLADGAVAGGLDGARICRSGLLRPMPISLLVTVNVSAPRARPFTSANSRDPSAARLSMP